MYLKLTGIITKTNWLILLNCNQLKTICSCECAAKRTVNYWNHSSHFLSASEQSNHCWVAAWENAGLHCLIPHCWWLTNLRGLLAFLIKGETSPLLRPVNGFHGKVCVCVVKCLFSKTLSCFAGPWTRTQALTCTRTQTHVIRFQPDLMAADWGLFNNTLLTFHLSPLRPNYLTITAYKWLFSATLVMVFVCRNVKGQKPHLFFLTRSYHTFFLLSTTIITFCFTFFEWFKNHFTSVFSE